MQSANDPAATPAANTHTVPVADYSVRWPAGPAAPKAVVAPKPDECPLCLQPIKPGEATFEYRFAGVGPMVAAHKGHE